MIQPWCAVGGFGIVTWQITNTKIISIDNDDIGTLGLVPHLLRADDADWNCCQKAQNKWKTTEFVFRTLFRDRRNTLIDCWVHHVKLHKELPTAKQSISGVDVARNEASKPTYSQTYVYPSLRKHTSHLPKKDNSGMLPNHSCTNDQEKFVRKNGRNRCSRCWSGYVLY